MPLPDTLMSFASDVAVCNSYLCLKWMLSKLIIVFFSTLLQCAFAMKNSQEQWC